ncbi:class I SAM-dependent RNA methyltransferase [Rhizosaccharibacter radicis]|uniref:Class I SAM-dependent RNA methyltransferase n=1 Tax=Rhizosaccharibacter radicis TaxID=2782605 RepID=A0ABT1VYG2_9PROT|nr:class I SAM-dependent RNA methyltransferase [Acetobacteraceae bacterium KSS12]
MTTIETTGTGGVPLRLRIEELGRDGDGIATTPEGRGFVRGGLPGEIVEASPLDGRHLLATGIIEPSPFRVEPPCSLFGRCGGCVVQHLHPAEALRWKTGLVASALTRAGFVLPAQIGRHQTLPRTRRRMDLAIRRAGALLLLGLHERGSDRVVSLTECHVLVPELFALIQPLRAVLGSLEGLRRTGTLLVNLLDSGPDLLLGTDRRLSNADRSRLAGFAADHGIRRIAWQPAGGGTPEPVSVAGPVHHRFGGIETSPPPGAFLQATADGEQAIVAAVLDALPANAPRSRRAVDLYAGCGTISLPLSDRVRTEAAEGHAYAAACLQAAAGGRRLSVQQRDLNRQPLMPRELNGAEMVVLDPPHAGAGAQIAPLCASDVARVAYVSCNPAALEKDASFLAAAGFSLSAVTVIDQFLWSANVESVCVFTRKPAKRHGPLPRPAR